MVDIQSPAAEIRRGIKKDRKKERKKNIMVWTIKKDSNHRAKI